MGQLSFKRLSVHFIRMAALLLAASLFLAVPAKAQNKFNQPGNILITDQFNNRVIEIDPSEPHASNTLRVGSGLIYPSCFPRTQERLSQAGIAVTAIDVSELQKAEGAVTCCSLIFEA